MTALDQVTFTELEIEQLRALVTDLAAAKSFEFTELRARAQQLVRPPRPAAGDGPLVRPTGPSPEPTQEHRQ